LPCHFPTCGYATGQQLVMTISRFIDGALLGKCHKAPTAGSNHETSQDEYINSQ